MTGTLYHMRRLQQKLNAWDKVMLKKMKVKKKWTLPQVSFMMRPYILGNQ